MKIAVLSDIHGNFQALETVVDHIERWMPDQVFVAGDIVNRGPRSLDCLEFLIGKHQNLGWQMIRGNHEDYVIKKSDPDSTKDSPYPELDQFVMFTVHQIKPSLHSLVALPESYYPSTPGLGEVRMVHASMIHNRDGIYPETWDDKLREKITPPPKLFIVGHTHRPLVRKLDGTLVVNVGSAGLPFDGDQRASYAQIEWRDSSWQARIVRVAYDTHQAEIDFYRSGYLEGGGPLAHLVLLEFKSGLSQLYQWSSRYMQPIFDGKITVGESTKRFLEEPITHPYW